MPDPQFKVCAQCGQRLALHMQHCGRCGFIQPQTMPPVAFGPIKHRAFSPLLLVSTCIFLAALVFFVFNLRSSSSANYGSFRLQQITPQQSMMSHMYLFWKNDGRACQEVYRAYMTRADGSSEVNDVVYDNCNGQAYLLVQTDKFNAPRQYPADSPQDAVQRYLEGRVPAEVTEQGPPITQEEALKYNTH